MLLSLRNLQWFQELCARSQAQKPIYIFSIISQAGWGEVVQTNSELFCIFFIIAIWAMQF